jgi:hypothetical protein
MKSFRYKSGEEVTSGDQIMYCGEPGTVEFVVVNAGDSAMDWYLDHFGGGFMIRTGNLGSVFVPEVDPDEDLVFVSRRERTSP